MKPPIRILAPVILAAAFVWCGCAINAPYLTETTTRAVGTNTVETTHRAMRIPTVALWPATATLESQKAALGKTLSVGTVGERADGGGTNITQTLVELNKLLGR